MKKLLKQTGVALSIALMTSGFAVAQDSGIVELNKEQNKEVVQEVAQATVAPVVEEVKKVEAPKKVNKVVKKVASKEITMKSAGNYVSPLQNVSLKANNEIIEAVYVEGLHVTPVVSIPELNSENASRYPLDVHISFPFKDAYGNAAPEGALVSQAGKNLNIYHFNTDLTKFDVQRLNSFTETYNGKHSIRECDVVLYQYQMSDDTEKAVDRIFLNKGKVSETPKKKGCKVNGVDRKETSQIDSNGYFLNVTFNKASATEGKPQEFSLLAMRDGKIASITEATTYVFNHDYSDIQVVEGTGKTKTGSHVFFNDLKLSEGSYVFVIKYTIDDKQNHIVLPKKVRK